MSNFITKRREPYRFMFWVFISSISLLFIAITIIYLIRKNASGWMPFHIPPLFSISTILIVASSFTLIYAKKAFNEERFKVYTSLIGTTLILGVFFIICQLLGWQQMVKQGILLQKNTGGAFVYMLSGLHILHILGGVFFMSAIFKDALKQQTYVDAFVYSVNPPTLLKIDLVLIYWHFIDILWIYLFVFFIITQR